MIDCRSLSGGPAEARGRLASPNLRHGESRHAKGCHKYTQNSGWIAPPSNADLIAIIRAKDDLICQLKTAALETDRLRDRVEQLEQLVGVDRSLTSRLRTAFGLEPGVAQVMGMLLKRDFVTHDALYVVLYAACRRNNNPINRRCWKA